MANAVITGTKSQAQFAAFDKKVFDLDEPYHKLCVIYRKQSRSTDSIDAAHYQNKINLLLDEIKTYPASLVMPYLIKRSLMYEMTVTDLELLYNSLQNRRDYYSNYLSKYLEKKRQTAIGMPAPAFTVTDKKNQIFTNRNFYGKYLLIDFWASWCVPCREESPNLLKAYQKFHDKGFQMLSVSIDKDKENWEKAIKDDGLLWPQVLDSAKDENAMSKKFGIHFIPTNFLIDTNGIILERNLVENNLEQTLEKYF